MSPNKGKIPTMAVAGQIVFIIFAPIYVAATEGVASNAFLEKSTQQGLDTCTADVARLRQRIVQLERVSAISGAEETDILGSPPFYQHAFMAFLCVALAALAAGLTMGLVSIEPMEMKIIVNTEEKDMPAETDKLKLKEDQAAAKRVLPLIQDHHRLLVTLLLMNSIAAEALPLFLDKIVPAWAAVLMSVTLVLMFGEIIPSAVFTGANQLRIASKFAPIVGFCQFLLAPVAWPMAKVLDQLLGEDHKGRYNFAELRAIVGIHANLRMEERGIPFKSHDDNQLGIITTERRHGFTDESVVVFKGTQSHPAKSTKLETDSTFYFVRPCAPLVGRDASHTFKLYRHETREPSDLITYSAGELESGAFEIQERDEIKIMHGVMKLTHMCAQDGLKPLSKVNMLDTTEELTREKLQGILECGHSRLPVFEKDMHNVRGFVLAKKMIVVSPEDNEKVGSLEINPLVLVPPLIPMLDLLNKFQEDRCHIALVTSDPGAVTLAWNQGAIIPPDVHMMGIVTLEDIIEHLIQEDIWDEHDSEGMTEKTPKPTKHCSPNPPKLAVTHAQQYLRRNTIQKVPSYDTQMSNFHAAMSNGNGGLHEPLLGGTPRSVSSRSAC